jgi:signal transduction histidine kinase
LEQNFDFRLPERSDELGGISKSINRMASVRRNLEREIRREDRLRAVGRLAAGLAHEIRNPLNSIRLTVQLLERRLDTNSIRREDLETVRSEVDRLNSLLDNLLDLQRSRQPIPRVQPVLPVLQHCITLVERQAEMQNTKVSLEGADSDSHACFDAQHLTQTVMNLLLNALEASAGGVIRVRVVEEKNSLKIEVQDSGPGLDNEQREHLFEPFYTTKPTGTGLGLAVSRELMRSQGGNLTYAPDGAGARFVVELPGG